MIYLVVQSLMFNIFWQMGRGEIRNPIDVFVDYNRHMGYGQYPSESEPDAPVPPALPVPNCCCGAPAEVKQSRHRKTAGRAYYMCCFTYVTTDLELCENLHC